MRSIKDAIEDLFDDRLSADVAVARHFAPDFRQRVNGTWWDRAAFLASIVQHRSAAKLVGVVVLDEHDAGDHYAERHIIELLLAHGERARQEVYLFAQRGPDGRFARIEETSFKLEREM